MEDNMMDNGMEEEKKEEGTGEMPEGTEEAGEKEEDEAAPAAPAAEGEEHPAGM